MTGDIFETSEEFKYGIVLTPKCDLIQSKTKKVLVCYGFPLRKKYFRKRNYPPHGIDPVIAELHRNGHTMAEIVACIEKRYLKESLPMTLPVIWNFSPEDGTFGICLDFNNVQSIEITEVKKWKRLSRIDSPYIEEILQKYGSLVSRIGTLEINRSPLQLQGTIKKMESTSESKTED